MSIFFNPTKGQLNFSRVIQEIIGFIQEDLNKRYRIIIGSDSEGNDQVDFVTAIVIYRVGRGGRYFWQKNHQKNIKTLRQKIYQEVDLSIKTALRLFEILRKPVYASILAKCDLEVHVDIGEGGETKALIKEIAGIVQGYGLVIKTKPVAFGASNVADRYL